MAGPIVQKQLAGAEDLLFGQGKVNQARGGATYAISKVNATVIPYSGDQATGNFVSIFKKIQTLEVGGGGGGASPIPPGYARLSDVDAARVEAYRRDMVLASTGRRNTFDVVGKYVNDITGSVADITRATGFGYGFGQASVVDPGAGGTAVGAGLNFGYSFGQAAALGVSKKINILNRGPAAWAFFGQI